MTTPDMIAWNTENEERQLAELREQAAKRFWEIYHDDSLGWHGVRDALGRTLQAPRPLAELRGFFAGLPPQA